MIYVKEIIHQNAIRKNKSFIISKTNGKTKDKVALEYNALN